ncbi:MAG: twin-arginine translocase TatA/TatE family subunit [Proteobacteria bacterium]|nr:twin-arginine translocase TatA/TatE family subunit [Pseudomonadota bacterium]
MLSPQDIALIGVIALFVFGPKKLPEMAKSLGQSVNEFKKGIKGGEENGEAAASQGNEGALPGAHQQQAVPSSTSNPQQLALPAQSSETRRV